MTDAEPDDLALAVVAARLGKSERWLQQRLAEDRRLPAPRLQYHHYVGRSPRWDENEYQALRSALIRPATERAGLQPSAGQPGAQRGSPSSRATDISTSAAGSASRDAASASARVQAWPLPPDNREAADELHRQKEQEIRDADLWGIRPSVPLAVAAEAYLNRPRKRPLNAPDGQRIKELDAKFGARRLTDITEKEWVEFVNKRMAGRAAVTRERYIDLVCSFLGWCKERPQQWLSDLPVFNRDKEAREHKEARARRVGELRLELIALLIEHAAPHLRSQMAVHWSTGARISSLIYGCRLCDYLAAPGREQITFYDTKNGRRVEGAVNSFAAAMMSDYLAWRGRLEDREGPLFLTDRRRPYAKPKPGKQAGGQTKTAFKGMVRRTIAALRGAALTEAARLRRAGQGAAARDHWRAVRQGDIALLQQLTPHWFRHLLATNLRASSDLRSTMEQGGWRDARSVLRYAHDVPERRRQLVEQMATPATFWPRAPAIAEKK